MAESPNAFLLLSLLFPYSSFHTPSKLTLSSSTHIPKPALSSPLTSNSITSEQPPSSTTPHLLLHLRPPHQARGYHICSHHDVAAIRPNRKLELQTTCSYNFMHVLSSGRFPVPLYNDGIGIKSFSAIKCGIPVVRAARNNGPIKNSVANEAPWITTIGASKMERRFPAFDRVGNEKYRLDGGKTKARLGLIGILNPDRHKWSYVLASTPCAGKNPQPRHPMLSLRLVLSTMR